MSLHTETLDTPNGSVLMIQSNNYVMARFDGDPEKNLLVGGTALEIHKMRGEIHASVSSFELFGESIEKVSQLLHSFPLIVDKAKEMLNKGMPKED